MTALLEENQSAITMEWVACELCGSEDRTPVVSRGDLLLGLGSDRLYHMVECGGCGALYQYPRPAPAALDQIYPETYQQYVASVATESRLRRIQRRYGLRKRCQVVLRYVQQGRLLDVGCATGDFLSEMKRQPNWSVVGIEPNHSAAVYAREHVGVHVISGMLNTAPFPDATFDAVTMWDVLEHVYDPQVVIAEVARMLRPGGVLVVNHPNLDSLDRRLFGRFWLGYELPRHMYLYPHALLQHLLAEYGLQELERRCSYGSHAATGTSLRFVMEAYLGSSALTRAVERAFFSKAGRLALVPYFKVIDSLRLGSNITVVFRKRV